MHQIATMSILMMGMLDPMAMMTGLQGLLRDKSTEQNETSMEVDSVRGDIADQARSEQIDQALQRAKDAVSGMPEWLQKTLGLVMSAIGAVASVFTAGASLALTGLGIALMVGGEILQLVAEYVPMSDDARIGLMIAAAAMKVAGSIVTTAGAGAGAATSEIIEWAAKIADYVSTAATLVNGSVDIHNAVVVNDVANFRLDAQGFDLESEEANEAIENAAERLQDTMKVYARAMGRIRAMLDLQGEMMAAPQIA